MGRIRRDDAIRHWSTLSLAPLGGWLGWSLILLSLLFGAEATRSALSDIPYETAFNQALQVPIDQSIQDAEQALTYDRGNAQDLIFLGDLYRYKASRQDDMAGRYSYGQKALDYYQQALKANSLDDTVHARMGMTFDLMQRYPEAFFCYQDAVTKQPYNGQFWYWLGNHYNDRGMLEKAEEAYLRAEKCPHGMEGSEEAIQELRALPGMQNAPPPSPDINPAQPSYPTEDHPPTIP